MLEKSLNDKVYYWVLIFLISSFIGWVYEEIFYFIFENIVTNRGFLYGPYLPVYGWGSVILMFILKKYKNRPIVVFLLSILITSIVEYVTGYAMFKIYNRTWWDYTGLFLNINGYVCLRSVITFAIGTMILMYILEPMIVKFISNSKYIKKYVCYIFIIIFIIDNILTYIFRY